MHRARSPFFRGGVILPALAMAAQGAAGARRRPSSAPADRKYRTERHGAADDRLTSIIVALGTCSELHPRLEVLGPLRGSSRERTLQGFSAVIRVRLATLGSLGKWAVRRDKIARNPVDVLTRPRRKARLPRVPRWETVESVLEQCTDVREKTLVALMCAVRRLSPSMSGMSRPAWGSGGSRARAGSKRPCHSPRSRRTSWPATSRLGHPARGLLHEERAVPFRTLASEPLPTVRLVMSEGRLTSGHSQQPACVEQGKF